MAEQSTSVASQSESDDGYREAVVDLLAAIAYGEMSAFERLADDAKLAPSLEEKLDLATMASVELGKVAPLHARIVELGAEPFAAMAPFREPFEAFHRHTAPADYAEGLVKALVGDGLANDFYREIAAYLDPSSRALVEHTMEESGHVDFLVQRVREQIVADPPLAGRLALWGRRLMGEALTQTQRVAADRDSLTALLTGTADRPGLDLAELGKMLTRLTERHLRRMEHLGLDA